MRKIDIQLEEATANYHEARTQWETAKTRKDKLCADADLTFWSNKMAMLEVMTNEK